MAKILKDTFGDQLFVPAAGQPGPEWQSPEQLRGKFLIRGNTSKLKNEDLKVAGRGLLRWQSHGEGVCLHVCIGGVLVLR